MPRPALPIACFSIHCDQDGPPWAGAQFLMDAMQTVVDITGDDDHDEWNICKWSLNRSFWHAWPLVCCLAPVFSFTKAPVGSGGYSIRMRETLNHLISVGSRAEAFSYYLREVARELGFAAPAAEDDIEVVWTAMAPSLNGFATPGDSFSVSRSCTWMAQFKQQQRVLDFAISSPPASSFRDSEKFRRAA